MLKDKQKPAKTLPQKLAGLNKERGAWGENLACGGVWQGVLLERNGVWQGTLNSAKRNTAQRGEFGNETAQRGKIQRHDNKIQHNEFIKVSTAQQIQQNTANLAMQTAQSVVLRAKQCTTQQARQIRLGKCGENGICRQNKAGDTANSARGQWGSACALCLEQKFGVRCRVAECGEFGNAQHSKFSLAGACGQSENGAVFGRGTSLSLSLSRCSHFLAHLWAKFKRLFYSFHHIFISSYHKFFLFHRGFSSYFRSYFSFYHSFNSSFCLQKAFFRALCFFEIFKCFVFGLLRPFCHFEPLQKGEKSTQIKRQLAIFGYFACTQYDKIYDTKSV